MAAEGLAFGMPSLDALAATLASFPRVMLGYSGGVDSALLAVVARQALGRERMVAVLGVSASLGEAQHLQARRLAAEFDFAVREVPTEELDDPFYRRNGLDRCYHCKRTLWTRLGALAREEGWPVLIDGTNADDLGEHRPGARAGQEAGVRSPLAESGWRKADVRAAARVLGLPIWDAPAAPCLASRIAPHLPVTVARLGQVERAERLLREAGITGDLRVRHRDALATIEVAPEMFATLDAILPDLATPFAALGFAEVRRDALGYRRGSLVVLATA